MTTYTLTRDGNRVATMEFDGRLWWVTCGECADCFAGREQAIEWAIEQSGGHNAQDIMASLSISRPALADGYSWGADFAVSDLLPGDCVLIRGTRYHGYTFEVARVNAKTVTTKTRWGSDRIPRGYLHNAVATRGEDIHLVVVCSSWHDGHEWRLDTVKEVS